MILKKPAVFNFFITTSSGVGYSGGAWPLPVYISSLDRESGEMYSKYFSLKRNYSEPASNEAALERGRGGCPEKFISPTHK
jgi:hypothetical protein